MKILKKLLALISLISAFTFCSCNSSISIMKRKYNDGFYVSTSNNTTKLISKTAKTNAIAAVDGNSESGNTTEEKNQIEKSEQKLIENEANKNKAVDIKESGNANLRVQKNNIKKCDTENINVPENVSNKGKSLTKVKLNKNIFSKRKLLTSNNPKIIIIFEVVSAILIPPLTVWFHEGHIGLDFWIDILWCFFFWFPGIIYALFVILAK